MFTTARRLKLHEKFCEILESRNAYFQPPASVKLNYDPKGCIVYSVARRDGLKADDLRYVAFTAYDCTYISRDPDSEIPDKLMQSFLHISHERTYTSDNLHHDLFRIYY